MVAQPFTAVFCLLLLGVAVRMCSRLYYGVRGPRRGDVVALFAAILSWTCLVLGFVAVGLLLFFLAFVPFLIGLLSFVELILARRERRRAAAWSVASNAAVSGRSIGDALRANAARFGGGVTSAALRVADMTDAGSALAQAAYKSPGAFPTEARACLAVSNAGGAPLHAATQAADAPIDSAFPYEVLRGVILFVALLFMALSIVTGTMIYIVPSFRDIFDEFALELPPLTESLIAGANVFANYWYLLVLPLFTVPLFVLVLLTTNVGSRVLPMGWSPMTQWRRCQALRLLALAVEERMSIDEALSRLAIREAFPAGDLQDALVSARDRVRRGDDWPRAFADVGLFANTDTELARVAQRAGNLPWALRSIADRQLERGVRRWRAWFRRIGALLIVGFGVGVGFFSIAMFAPLVTMIESLS